MDPNLERVPCNTPFGRWGRMTALQRGGLHRVGVDARTAVASRT